MILDAKTLAGIRPLRPFIERTVIRGRSAGLSVSGYDIRCAEGHCLRAGKFVLGSSLEEFDMPLNLVGIIHDKSSWIRIGLTVGNCVIESGWKGHLTLELFNKSDKTIVIHAGDPIAQVLFHLTYNTTEGYGNGKYQNQEAGPQEARYE